MWSKKPMPVASAASPRPSRPTRTRMRVSFVSRRTSALRLAGVFIGCSGMAV
jgi:hypothetical protein